MLFLNNSHSILVNLTAEMINVYGIYIYFLKTLQYLWSNYNTITELNLCIINVHLFFSNFR